MKTAIIDLSIQKKCLMQAVLAEIPMHGVGAKALECAAQSLQMEAGEAFCLFPQGIDDVLSALTAHLDEAMRESYTVSIPSRVRDKVMAAVWARLEAQVPYKTAVRHLVGYYALHTAAGLRTLYHTSDSIWWLVGEVSTDWNYYSKRTLLMAVYSATLAYWLQDDSIDHQDSKAFLERRLNNVMRLQGIKKKPMPEERRA
jgi:ubiquinone biosynthesis protein COQ9